MTDTNTRKNLIIGLIGAGAVLAGFVVAYYGDAMVRKLSADWQIYTGLSLAQQIGGAAIALGIIVIIIAFVKNEIEDAPRRREMSAQRRAARLAEFEARRAARTERQP